MRQKLFQEKWTVKKKKQSNKNPAEEKKKEKEITRIAKTIVMLYPILHVYSRLLLKNMIRYGNSRARY